jgi:hypothetical protein
MVKHFYGLIFVVVLLTTACAPQAPVVPTTAPIATTEAPTQGPTATPLDLRRPTLPPTWTPASESAGDAQATLDPQSPDAQSQSTQVQPTPAFVPPTALEVCTGFGEDRTRNLRTFEIGESPQVFWTAVEGAASYSISLVDETGEVLLTDYTVEPTFTFEAETFEEGKFYGWEAYPIDPVGQQMCIGRGAELFPEDPLAIDES